MSESAMQTARVVLEACPPLVQHRDKAYAILEHCLRAYTRFDLLSAPDIQDDAEFGRQRRQVSNLDFAAWMRDQVSKPICLYKVAVANDRAGFETWLDRAAGLGCNDIFVVGGDDSDKDYGPDALTIGSANKVAHRRGFHTGGILIPTRRREFVGRPAKLDEIARIQDKIHTWQMRFFSTQLLYEAEWMSCLLLDMCRALAPEDFPKLFFTFSPFVCEEDLSFAKKYLGVYVPADVERMLLGSRNMAEASVGHLMLIFERLTTFAGEIGIPEDRLGVNVEYINSRDPRNVRAAFELAEEFGRILGVKA